MTWAANGFGQGSMDVAQAEALYNEANKLMTAKQYEQACPKFAESHRLDPGVGTLLKLATCYEQLNKTASAWASLLEAQLLAEKNKDAARAGKAKARATQLVPKLTRMNVNVSSAAGSIQGLEVRRDGELIGKGQWGQALPVDPGTYQIEASAPGRKTWSTRIDAVGPGKTIAVEIPLLEETHAEAPLAPDHGENPTSPNGESKPNGGQSSGVGVTTIDDPHGKPDELRKTSLTHARQLGAFFRTDVDGKFRGQVSVFGLSYGLGNHVDVAAGALVGKDKGVWAGATAYILPGNVKPRLTLGTHLFFAGGVQFGLHGAGGLQWDPMRHLGVFIDAGVSFWPKPRPNYEQVVFVPSVGVQGRL